MCQVENSCVRVGAAKENPCTPRLSFCSQASSYKSAVSKLGTAVHQKIPPCCEQCLLFCRAAADLAKRSVQNDALGSHVCCSLPQQALHSDLQTDLTAQSDTSVQQRAGMVNDAHNREGFSIALDPAPRAIVW